MDKEDEGRGQSDISTDVDKDENTDSDTPNEEGLNEIQSDDTKGGTTAEPTVTTPASWDDTDSNTKNSNTDDNQTTDNNQTTGDSSDSDTESSSDGGFSGGEVQKDDLNIDYGTPF